MSGERLRVGDLVVYGDVGMRVHFDGSLTDFVDLPATVVEVDDISDEIKVAGFDRWIPAAPWSKWTAAGDA
jgi:hypothetical protein